MPYELDETISLSSIVQALEKKDYYNSLIVRLLISKLILDIILIKLN